MRTLLGTAALLATSAAFAQSVPIEKDAIITKVDGMDLTKVIEPAVGMIRAHGWRCDSISAMRPFLMSRGFTVVCNGFSYEYEFEDRGGNWVVTLG